MPRPRGPRRRPASSYNAGLFPASADQYVQPWPGILLYAMIHDPYIKALLEGRCIQIQAGQDHKARLDALRTAGYHPITIPSGKGWPHVFLHEQEHLGQVCQGCYRRIPQLVLDRIRGKDTLTP